MRELLGEVLDLQKVWRSENTKEMERRGLIIRDEIPDWLRAHREAIAQALGVPPEKVGVEGRDATGRKSQIPWTRVYSTDRSPRSTTGWYVVYLFSASGDRVYLSLMQATTVWTDGEFKPRKAAALKSRVAWARPVVASQAAKREDLANAIQLNARTKVGRSYALGNVVAIEYMREALPDPEVLVEDLLYMASLLAAVYKAESAAPHLPGDIAPEVVEAEESASKAAGRRSARHPGQGFLLTGEERRAVESHSVHMASEHFKAQGWSVQDVGTKKPYDLHLSRGQETLRVEVKGTTSDGSQVILTRSEVEHQRKFAPSNALVIVHSITLDRAVEPAVATGGTLECISPWVIDDGNLTVVSYIYRSGI
ncbi:MrcB family domain-containing protein [Streptomyces albogriseolus]|uniref:MrcB family domain-containing protein n=1 Tax=Streptomyces albogriseolus TaxID=1887 RepID=UPI0034600B5E